MGIDTNTSQSRSIKIKTTTHFIQNLADMESTSSVLYNQYPKQADAFHQGGKIIAEYVWIDGSGITLRSKCRTLEKKVEKLADLPEWNYDGSSCYQASAENSEII